MKTVDGILKELAVYAPVYNLVRVLMQEAAQRQGRDVERVSFVDALRWQGLRIFNVDTAGEFPSSVQKPML